MALYNIDEVCPGLPTGQVCEVCAGDTIPLGDTLCDTADRIIWTQTAGPAASQALIDDANAAITNFTLNNNGRYTFKRCCYFDLGGPALPPIVDEVDLLCPEAGLVGDILKFTVVGCDEGTVAWTTSAAVIQNQGAFVAYITPDVAGPLSVSVICSVPGSPDVFKDCGVIIYEQDREFEEIEKSIEVTGFACGEICRCETVDVIVGCSEEEQIFIKTPIFFKEKLPTLQKPEKIVLTPIRLIGSPLPVYQCKDERMKDCEGNICCDTHQPALLIDDVYNCGWEFSATGVNGTNIYNAMGSNPGLKFCFQGTTTITMSGPAAFIDTVVLYGHNMTDAKISTAPLSTADGSDTNVMVVSDSTCADAYTLPVIRYLGNVTDTVTNFSITITPADPSKIYCIQHIFVGRKLLLKNYPDTWKNPFFGSDREVIVREGDCGPTSVSVKRRRIPLNIPLRAGSEAEYKASYLPIINYLHCGNPVMFAWSINQCEFDLFYGWVDGVNEGAEYEDGSCPINSIDTRGWIRQIPPKVYE